MIRCASARGVLAELARRDLVPEVWLLSPSVRGERERARYRMHLVRRTMLKNRIHQTLIAHGHARPTANLFTAKGRALLAALELPDPWRGTVEASLALIETLDEQIDNLERELRRLGADHQYIPPAAAPLPAKTVMPIAISLRIASLGARAMPLTHLDARVRERLPCPLQSRRCICRTRENRSRGRTRRVTPLRAGETYEPERARRPRPPPPSGFRA
jgi:transposase